MSDSLRLDISGLTCERCARTAEAALNALAGVAARVWFEQTRAEVESNGETDVAAMLRALSACGFEAKPSETGDDDSTAERPAATRVAIIGTGSGAFAAAIQAADRGAQVTLIESCEVIGGTCVNVGCVPSKIMIAAAHVAHAQSRHPFEGLGRRGAVVDRAVMVAQQQARVSELREAKYERILDNYPNIRLVRGRARFLSPDTLQVALRDGGEQEIGADRMLIATGASPAMPDIPGLADTPYWTSAGAPVAVELPEHLLVIGGSAVAVELGQAFARLGLPFTLLARRTLLSREEPIMGERLREVFEAEDIRVITHCVPRHVAHDGTRFTLELDGEYVTGDRLLVAAGRVPNTGDLALGRAGVTTDARGAIVVDAHMRTSAPYIYAAGDCTGQPQYVYVAAAAGTRAGRNMTGGDNTLDLNIVPAVVFTDPKAASVGLTEDQARAQGIDAESRTLDLANVPRALANFEANGCIKLVAKCDSGRLLGAQVIAAQAGEVIQAAALALANGMTIAQLADQLFPYLTMVEGLKLCAQTFTRDVKQLSCCAG